MSKNFDQNSGTKHVAIYTRFSSKLQRTTSTEDQIRDCREAAENQGWIVLDDFIRSDERKSGQFLSGRDGLDELMNLAQQKDCPFDGIVIYDTSRFGRNLTDGLMMTDILKYAGIFLFFTTRDLDSRDKNFRKLFIDCASQDEDYCFEIAARVHRAQRGAALKGYASSGRAYGYKNVPIPSSDGTRWRNGRAAVDGVRREVIPEEAAVINRIFEMYAAGLGQQAIAIKLNADGVPSTMKAYGHPDSLWCTPTIAKILKNTKYIGINTWNKTKVVRNPIEQRKEEHKRPESEWERVEVPAWRIVSDELWEWALDFASDVTAAGQRFRVFGVIDSFTRQCLVLDTAASFPSRRVTRMLDRAIAEHGKPQSIRCDNGPELTSRHFLAWAIEWKIDLLHIQPGKPTQNGGMESFNGKLRDECLNTSWFWNLFDARVKISSWKAEYNSRRPHSSLGYRTPDEFARQWQAASLSEAKSMAASSM